MLPKYHILFGAIFSFLIYLIFPITIYNMLIIFFSSVLIDIDHYLVYVKRKKFLNPKNAINYFIDLDKKIKFYIKKKKKVKAPLVFLHTIEVLIFLVVLSLFYNFFFFILIGFLFHFLSDIVDMYLEFKTIYPRIFLITLYFIYSNRKDIKFL